MKEKRWAVRLAAGILVIAVLAGAALAAGQQGTQSDPLVTLSYLTEKATPDILAQVDELLARRGEELTAQLQQVVDSYEAGTGSSPGGTGYTIVTVKQGQTLTASAGCEVLLRSGTAVCTSSAESSFVDMTGGSSLSGGESLVQNHLYLSAADGREIKAASDLTLMVRGAYTIKTTG